METKEIWKDVKGYEGHYQVSNLGRVKSLNRFAKAKSNGTRFIKERILSPAKDGGGYYKVSLHKNTNRKTLKIHKLVAMAFLGHKPCGYNEVVDHIDNNKLNNRLDNLQLTTQRHNLSKDKKGGTSKYTGVYWYKARKKWRSSIRYNGKKESLGYFNDEIEASKAYQDRLKSIIGGYNG